MENRALSHKVLPYSALAHFTSMILHRSQNFQNATEPISAQCGVLFSVIIAKITTVSHITFGIPKLANPSQPIDHFWSLFSWWGGGSHSFPLMSDVFAKMWQGNKAYKITSPPPNNSCSPSNWPLCRYGRDLAKCIKQFYQVFDIYSRKVVAKLWQKMLRMFAKKFCIAPLA